MAKKEKADGIVECLALLDLPAPGLGSRVDLVTVVAAKAFIAGWSPEKAKWGRFSLSSPVINKLQNAMRDFETGFDSPERVVSDWNKFLKHLSREVTPS